ncbi:MAG: isoleucine--tRNA ligase [Clostridiales bacterium]|nr:MAG: isoleucine--tRNA ligase [Clostridiales bacterium]
MYNKLNLGNTSDSEKTIRKYWNDIDLLKEAVNTRDENKPFVFFEGPPTANGRPGVHHVIARALKDGICRYKTMQGFRVKRKAGWDTHGLPVELEVEKRLGLSDKTEIEDYGIGEFNKKCRESVFEYESLWRDMTEKMAYMVDLDDPYITLDNNYIESVWWILDKFFKEGYIYDGYKILPYCTRCGTGLASHEVAQGYEEIKNNTVIAKFKALDEENTYYLAWTTTPWTLAANVALAVNKDEIYLKVKENGEYLYVAKSLAEKVLQGDYEVVSEVKGSELENREYEQLMPFVKADKKAFYIVTADYVTTSDGTGIVHTAPAFGEDDYRTGQRYGLPVLQPVNEKGLYTATPWEGRNVLEEKVEVEIIIWLHDNAKLYSKQKIAHNYPHCWRCKTPLLYYAKPSWYIEVTKLKDKLIQNNNTVNWHPDYVGEKRFGNWLENLNDWAISRSRYWGTPLNIWKCECGEIDSVGSRKELVERAVENIDESIELHRPFIDDIHLTCKCGKTMTRVKDVVDCWFDSGAMPFAQHHYPFENSEHFDKLFPANFICEGIDQTRGWFYSLLAISTFVMGVSPYKNVLVNDLILDKDGKKMSKSRGNIVDPFRLFDDYGADATRWCLYYSSPAWQPTKFDEAQLRELNSKFFGTLKNSYTFFSLYANTDKLDVNNFDIPVEKRAEIDRWIISKLNKVIKNVVENFEAYDMTKVARTIYDFVVEDFSNWYIRRNRRRFWESALTDDKKAVYRTTFEVLETVARLIAPLSPYISEEIYRNLTGEKSVHLASYPKYNESLVSEKIENRMDLVRELVKLGRAAREDVKIKVRQPLYRVYVSGENRELIFDLKDLIMEELNVKEVIFEDNLSQYMDFKLKPNFRALGPVLGKNMGEFSKNLATLNQNECAKKLKNGENIIVSVGGEDKEFDIELIEVNISAKDGLTVAMENNLFVILDTKLDDTLINEGFAREFVSKIQQMRKSNDYDVADKIVIKYSSDEVVKNAISQNIEYIQNETLALDIKFEENLSAELVKLNDSDCTIFIAKA